MNFYLMCVTCSANLILLGLTILVISTDYSTNYECHHCAVLFDKMEEKFMQMEAKLSSFLRVNNRPATR
jgi:hypothetical protein